jgi:dihydrofolate reductase
MRKLIYSMSVSLDGFIAGPDGGIEWSAPDAELHGFFNQQAGETAVELYGRRLYETMVPWETRDQDPSAAEIEREFSEIWRDTEKIVFSTTLGGVEGTNIRLADADPAEQLARVREGSGGDVAVGGAGLASTFIRLGLVDEFRPFVHPIVVGGGTPFIPALEAPLGLTLLETRTFGSGVVYLRYASRAA